MSEAETHRADVPQNNPAVAHETSDTSLGGVLAFGIGLIVLAVIVHVLMWWMFRVWQQKIQARQPAVSPLAEEQRGQLPPAPLLEGLELPQRVTQRRAESAQPSLTVDEAVKLLHGKIQVRSADQRQRWKHAERPIDSSSGRILEEKQ